MRAIYHGNSSLNNENYDSYKFMYSFVMKLSIILANLNRVELLEKCLASYQALNKDILDIELIVVDGLSTDGSLDLLNKHADKIISEKDKSVYEAWNKGVNLADGDWIFFLNSDDYLLTHNFNKLLVKLSKTNCEIINFPVQISQINSKKNDSVLLRVPKYNFRSIISEPCYFNGYFFHRKVFAQVGIFSEQFKHCADQDFLWRCLENGIKCETIMLPSYGYVSHAGSLTLKKGALFFKEEILIAQKFMKLRSNPSSYRYSIIWYNWERISLKYESTIKRIIYRLFRKKIFIQQLYSIFEKILQSSTSSKIFLLRKIRKV